MLVLPDRQARLDLVDECRAGRKRLAAVGGAHCGREGAVAYLEWPDAVQDGDADDVESVCHVGGHLGEDAGGARVGFIFEALDDAAVVVVSDIAGEGHGGSRAGALYERGQVGGGDGIGDHVGDQDAPRPGGHDPLGRLGRFASRQHWAIIGPG